MATGYIQYHCGAFMKDRLMNRNILSWIAIVICVLCMIGVLITERNIYLEYQAATGKTSALFSLNELSYLKKKCYLIFGGLIGLVLTFIAYKRKETKTKILIALGLSTFTIVIPIIRVWRLFI